MTKVKELIGKIKEKVTNWAADLAVLEAEMYDRHPFLFGCKLGIIWCYLFFVIAGTIAKRHGKAWGFVDIDAGK